MEMNLDYKGSRNWHQVGASEFSGEMKELKLQSWIFSFRNRKPWVYLNVLEKSATRKKL
jgi:hypothetical protein